MEKRQKGMMYSIIMAIVLLGLSAICWIKPADEFSATERRQLEQFPEISVETILSGKFMEDFEEYTQDQFPFRDTFRSIKSWMHKYVLGQADNKDVYAIDGYISKLDYPLSEKALDRAVRKFDFIYQKYIEGTDAKVYSVWIPDKNVYLAKENGYPAYDYDILYEYMNQELTYMTNIDIREYLSIEDYYRTDTHWKQENIVDVAGKIANVMGISLRAEYESIETDAPFYGVYYGQYGLPVEPDSITYLENKLFADCIITNHDTGKQISMYDLTRLNGRDPYEMYLSGSVSVITIENPNATSAKELVIFRDSYGSSLAPLLVEGYAKIILLDVRYLNQNVIGNFVTFDNQDVLFLYSTIVLNNETTF